MELETVKKHLRVIDDFEDDVILIYLDWAEQKVKDSVTNDPMPYELFFNENSHYKRAVALLTAHYFRNRLPLVDKPQHNLTFGLRDALSHLQVDFIHYKNELEAEFNEYE